MVTISAGTLTLAAAPTIPGFWDARERLIKPDMSTLARLRFLTTVDFPPFNFLDWNGRLSGFNIDLARAICTELEIEDRCQIQALPWEELAGALEEEQGEAVLAGLAVTDASRRQYAFSRSYLRFPARFITRRAKPFSEPLPKRLAEKRVGVLANSAHEAMLRDLFPEVRVVTYTRSEWLLDDLKEDKLDAVFGDGMRLGFWLADEQSLNCCIFAGGPYLAPEYLGQGLAIAVSRDNPELAEALDYALQQIDSKGVFAELYLRYFPISFY
ncbi:transporter substrate-binding domain-containing protein [Mesorhizobium sp. J18]|uniref:transporter substrate-binding domain-containing protein n=1 Tax=Mesorhizobium sp. J18 TaxID=935263 RepID=UPI0011A3F607|nr:transporter substrate-binding domain-containing protein [Mesorhizobium sp. J18]